MIHRSAVTLPVLLAFASFAGERQSEPTAVLNAQIPVSWDFGSGPGRTSSFYVGNRTIEVRYDSSACMSRFTLEGATYEFAQVLKDGKPAPGGPPFLMLKLRKRFSGDFALLPKITIMQNEYSATGKPTKGRSELVFPFREKKMAGSVKDWTRDDIEVILGVPGQAMELHNPLEWQSIEVVCE